MIFVSTHIIAFLDFFFFGTFNLLLLVILVVVTHAQYDWPDF